jgi:hypothetical protein
MEGVGENGTFDDDSDEMIDNMLAFEDYEESKPRSIESSGSKKQKKK